MQWGSGEDSEGASRSLSLVLAHICNHPNPLWALFCFIPLLRYAFTLRHTHLNWRRQWQPTPVFLPGESQGRGSLVGRRLWGAQSRTRLKRLCSSSSRHILSIQFSEFPHPQTLYRHHLHQTRHPSGLPHSASWSLPPSNAMC